MLLFRILALFELKDMTWHFSEWKDLFQSTSNSERASKSFLWDFGIFYVVYSSVMKAVVSKKFKFGVGRKRFG